MSKPLSADNPFTRGYQHLQINRLLLVLPIDGSSPRYLPLHPSQHQLHDLQIRLYRCVFNDEFALITEGQSVDEALRARCPHTGSAGTVIYAITGNDGGQPVHVGDTYSQEDANTVVHRLHFETGFYSRCWEISSAHLSSTARLYLESQATTESTGELLFDCFEMPHHCLGVKLIGTPWTAGYLERVHGSSTEALHQLHRDSGMPGSLLQLLHQAALADTRLLIFDPDAPVLQGLPVFDD
jgi:hypothetical protein